MSPLRRRRATAASHPTVHRRADRRRERRWVAVGREKPQFEFARIARIRAFPGRRVHCRAERYAEWKRRTAAALYPFGSDGRRQPMPVPGGTRGHKHRRRRYPASTCRMPGAIVRYCPAQLSRGFGPDRDSDRDMARWRYSPAIRCPSRRGPSASCRGGEHSGPVGRSRPGRSLRPRDPRRAHTSERTSEPHGSGDNRGAEGPPGKPATPRRRVDLPPPGPLGARLRGRPAHDGRTRAGGARTAMAPACRAPAAEGPFVVGRRRAPGPAGGRPSCGRDESHNLARPANSKKPLFNAQTRGYGGQCNRKVRRIRSTDKRPAKTRE